MRFQQLTGPLMAKGIEDTAFYRYNKLLSLCEVGGEPGPLRHVGHRVPPVSEAPRGPLAATP